MIYPLAYAGTVAALALWFLYRTDNTKSNFFQAAFFLGLAAFMVGVGTSGISWGDKLGVLFRDLTVMAARLAFQFLALKKHWFIIGSIASAGFLGWYYQSQMAGSLEAKSTASPSSYDPSGELLVELSEGAGQEVLATVIHKYGLRLQTAFDPGSPEETELDDYLLVDVPNQHIHQLEAIIHDFQEVSAVDWIEPNELIRIEPAPAKKLPDINRRFGINDPGLAQMWGFEVMEVDKLYDYLRQSKLTPRKKALIAILDTGVDAQHEDLKDNYRSLKEADDNDPKGHGTHCAGIAAAVSNNGKGVASFSIDNSFIEVTSIKVLSGSGIGTQQMIIKGMLKAADEGAAVISMSLGGLSNQTRERAYRKAVEYANKKGAIVVAAAGNSNRNAKGYAPAGVPGVIAVSAVNDNLDRAVFSNYVTDLEMGLAAPGVNIYSTIPNNRYSAFNGTSMATPYVSGLVGLLKSFDPDMDTATAYRLMDQSGKATKNTAETGRLIRPFHALAAFLQQGQAPL